MLYLWQRYFLKKLFKNSLLILLSIYLLYVIIDTSSHFSIWRPLGFEVAWKKWSLYYICEFSHRADLLLPFACLAGSIQTLISLHSQGELTALLCSGIALKCLLKPFFLIALLLGLLLSLNYEYLLPKAMEQIKELDTHKKKRESGVQEIRLADNSRLLYGSYDPKNALFEDFFWIKANGNIIRMRSLSIAETIPRGQSVEWLHFGEEHRLTLVKMEESVLFPELSLEKKALRSAVLEVQSLSALWLQLGSVERDSYREAQLKTLFYQRLALPWLSLLILLIVAPQCIGRDRRWSPFALYSLTFVGFLSCYLLMDSVAVLAKRQLISPLCSLLTPFVILLFYQAKNYWSKYRPT